MDASLEVSATYVFAGVCSKRPDELRGCLPRGIIPREAANGREPMAILLVEYRTHDFAGWKQVFDRDPMNRGGSGVTRHWIYRDVDDPAHLVLSLEFASAEGAKTFLDLLEPVREVSGVVRTSVLDEAEAVTY
jgi:hypothetical protein